MKGKWQPMWMVIGDGMKWIASRVLNTDHVAHSGNIEHYGEYTKDKQAVEKLCKELNEQEDTK